MNFLIFVSIAFGNGPLEKHVRMQSSIMLDAIDAPRPWLDSRAYMQRAYAQAKKAGATKRQMKRLREIAHRESCGNPRLCVPGGCGPFQNEVHSLLPKRLRNVYLARAMIRFLLTNHPGFAARTALDLLHRCEILAKEHWSCCYGGAYRPECRIKWDERYRDLQNLTFASPTFFTPSNFTPLSQAM